MVVDDGSGERSDDLIGTRLARRHQCAVRKAQMPARRHCARRQFVIFQYTS